MRVSPVSEIFSDGGTCRNLRSNEGGTSTDNHFLVIVQARLICVRPDRATVMGRYGVCGLYLFLKAV